jgi:hypothetical protein
MRSSLASFSLAVAIASLAAPLDSLACGGCFAPPPPSPERAQVVTDHRMVLALSQRQTTLWDQIRYTGDPEDFVWVLPVANAATLQIGLADNAFVEALDVYSAPFVTAELPECWRRSGRVTRPIVDSGAFVGCGADAMGGFGAMPGVESTRVGRDGEAVVGPYAVTVVSTDNGGARLDTWLNGQGYAIPESTRAAINYYVALQFDFVILRLRPGAGVHQMQPVRITTRGYSPMLPLRMIAAGIGDKVGLSLMVIASGRMQTQGFANEVIDERSLEFDYATGRSSWRTAFQRALARRPGRTWVIESVQNITSPQLVYGGSAPPAMPPPVVATLDGSTLLDAATDRATITAPDADRDADDVTLVLDGDTDAAALTWDASDAFAADALANNDDAAPSMTLDGSMMIAPWEAYIDRRYAFAGLDDRAVITRMRTELSLAALDGDLILDGATGAPVSVEYIAPTLLNAPPCPRSGGVFCAVVGGAAPIALEALGVVSMALLWRRRRAAKRADHRP